MAVPSLFLTADRAIDGNTSTFAITRRESYNWWEAKLEQLLDIERILVYLVPYAHEKGFYSKFKTEVRRSAKDEWIACVDEFAVCM